MGPGHTYENASALMLPVNYTEQYTQSILFQREKKVQSKREMGAPLVHPLATVNLSQINESSASSLFPLSVIVFFSSY